LDSPDAVEVEGYLKNEQMIFFVLQDQIPEIKISLLEYVGTSRFSPSKSIEMI
jgi:hypothetical protein